MSEKPDFGVLRDYNDFNGREELLECRRLLGAMGRLTYLHTPDATWFLFVLSS